MGDDEDDFGHRGKVVRKKVEKVRSKVSKGESVLTLGLRGCCNGEKSTEAQKHIDSSFRLINSSYGSNVMP